MIPRKIEAYYMNRDASSPKSRPIEILKHLDLHEGQVVADLGAGGGFYTVCFSKIVGNNGLVYSIDNNRQMLYLIESMIQAEHLSNIKTVHSSILPPLLPKRSLNLVFLRNVYHHLTRRPHYFKKLSPCLADNGKVAIVENNTRQRFRFLFNHATPKDVIIEEMAEAGFGLSRDIPIFKTQSFLIFFNDDHA
jgi:arsenite methyltransferase